MLKMKKTRTALYVRSGAPNYALVLIDGFPVNDPGGEFDFGKTLPLEFERVEVTRGAASSVCGGDLENQTGELGSDTTSAELPEALRLNLPCGAFSWRAKSNSLHKRQPACP
jgi:hypothetical protein